MSEYQELLDTREIDGFTVEIYALEESEHPDDTYEWQSEESRKETLQLMEDAGNIGWFCAGVYVYKNGIELAKDFFGGCSYRTSEEFLNDDYCKDMIDTALDEAKKNLPELIKKLSEG